MSEMIDRLNTALEGRYRIERELGEGGMATVYLAEDVRHARKVAVKVLRPELAAVVGAERFLAEIKTTASLQHPHILPLHDSGEADSFLFYVMPYIEGESLRDRLERDRQLPVDDAIEIARKVASALEYAHEQDIVHRDIKPANILMSRGEPLVADFGIALALSQAGGGRITETGLSLGTPHYMSPEQASGERSLDKRSDVYAVGAVLYEMLTGEPPYGGPTAQAVLARILTEVPRRITDIRRTVPPHVDAAVSKALEKLPADRFDSAGAFREALADESFRHATREAPAVPVSPASDDGRAGGGGRSVSVLVGIAVVATLAAVAGWLRTPEQVVQPPVRFDLNVDSLTPHFHEFTISPDGSKLVIVTPEGLFLRSADDAEFRPVRGAEEARGPVFSPDGQWIAFSRRGESLQKVSVEGGSPLTLASPEPGVYMPHWGPDGEIVFASPAGLFRVSDTGGEPVQLNTAGRYPRLLPGGAGILYGTSSQGIGWTDLAGDSVRVLVAEGLHPIYVPEIGHILYGHPDGGLFAVPFDPSRGEVSGAIRPVLDEVATGGYAAAFDASGNGTLLYRRGGGGGGGSGELMALIDLDGTVDTLPLTPREFDNPRFSPDGRYLAFEGEDQIYTYDLELGTTTQLTFEGNNHRPVWSPDGARVAYASGVEGAADDVLMVKAVDGASAAVLVLDISGDEHPVDWPLEDVLAFELDHEGGTDLMLVDPTADEPKPRAYLQAEWNEVGLSVSPSGALAAYHSDETGAPQVFVRRFPEPQGQWRISEGQGFYPTWSAAGDVIYYWASPAAEDSLYAARVRTEGAVVVESRELITAGEYDFDDSDHDPVSGRFVVVQNVGTDGSTATQGLWLVVNWFAELRERLGERGGR